ncbi:MAG: NAD(P)H-hydrate epimerase, partial [Planctomycetota bacterium]
MSADEPQPPPIIPASESGITHHAAQIMGVDLGALMQRAGAAVAEVAKEWAPKGAILIACGPGNNGGDGYVAARLLAEQGREVWLWAVSDPRSPLCDREAARLPDTVRRIAGITEGDIPALIIDAVLGAGVSGALRGGIAEAMAQLRSLGAPCLAVDLPTGLSSGEHVTPCLCLCLHAAKREAVDAGLEVRVADIGMPEQAWARVQPSCLRAWPPHAASGHKGQHGSLLVVAGWRFQGALQISAQAALRLGCDLVHAWAPGDIPLPASVVHHRRERGQPRGASEEDTYELLLLMKKVDAVLLGPGLGTDQTAIDLAATVWTYSKHLELPLVIDADGLYAVAQD